MLPSASPKHCRGCRRSPPATPVFVRDGYRCWIVQQADIRLFESEGNYVRVHFANERPLIRRSDLLEQQLDAEMFFRANRRQILNLACVERTIIDEGGMLTVVLRGGDEVELSRRQSLRFRERFQL